MPEKKRIISDIVPTTSKKTPEKNAGDVPVRKAPVAKPSVQSVNPSIEKPEVAEAESTTSFAGLRKRIGPKPRKFNNTQLAFLQKQRRTTSTTPAPKKSTPRSDVSFTEKKGNKKVFLLGGALLVVLVVLYALLSVFSSATVEIVAKESEFQLSRPLTLTLPTEQIRIAETAAVTGESVETKDLNQKARGNIAVFNAFSSSPQTLVTNTRFRSPDGNIYRIGKEITVPGALVADGKITPQSITVEVVSDNAGEEYNLSSGVTFDIPGFLGSARYEGFYAESVEAIDGGFIGEVKVVGEQEVVTAQAQARAQAIAAAEAVLSESVPDGFVLIGKQDVAITSETSNPDIGDPGETFTASAVAGGTYTLVAESDLLAELEQSLFDDFPAVKNNIELISSEDVAVVNESAGTAGSVVEVRDAIAVSWRPDEPILANALAGAKVRQIPTIFQEYESILSAEVKFSPSWWRKLPKNPEKIRFEYR